MAANLDIVIRFKNSAATLPGVLRALRAQSVQPARIIGMDSGCTDGSASLVREAGGEVFYWGAPYHHSRVLNDGIARCTADSVLVLSSHTVLHDPGTLAAMLAQLDLPGTACVSGKWTDADAWSDAITWDELRRTGLRFCSIYSNSFGMLRRELWQRRAFDTTLPTMEDYEWALEYVKTGHTCRRLGFPFSYQRNAHSREFSFAAITFHLARRHGLRVGWLGLRGTLSAIAGGLLKKLIRREVTLREHSERLRAFAVSTLTAGKFCPVAET